MAELTKEWLKQTIAEYEANRDELPFGLDTNSAIELQAFKLALASLEAEKVTLYRERNPYNGMTTGWQELTEQEYEFVKDNASENAEFRTVYTAPPAPVVPAALPENDDEDGHDIDYLEPSEVYALGRTAGWNACRAAMLQSGNFRENKNSSTNNFREIAETSTNYPVIPSEVLSAILKVAKIRADFDDFDGDRRGIGDCLDEAEQELIVTINKYASQLAAEPIATNDVREQTAVPPVPVIQADVAQAIEKLKRKLVECNRYNYCADAVKGVEYACHAAMIQGSQPVSNHEELPLDYLQGQKDGLEWAAQLAEANHPQTGDWLYDDPLELAKAIRKGPDMPEFDGPTPVTPDGWISCSERMPEETGDIIVVSDGIVMSGISYSRRDGFYIAALEYDDDEPIGGVTHWMPLPEPPQEVK